MKKVKIDLDKIDNNEFLADYPYGCIMLENDLGYIGDFIYMKKTFHEEKTTCILFRRQFKRFNRRFNRYGNYYEFDDCMMNIQTQNNKNSHVSIEVEGIIDNDNCSAVIIENHGYIYELNQLEENILNKIIKKLKQ